MSRDAYDQRSIDSIVSYSKRLTGHSLQDLFPFLGDVENPRSKGDLGRLIELHFFGITPSNSHIDFLEAGLELKVTGLKKRKDGSFVAKERLVLGMINFHNLVEEDWETSYIFLKCQIMLILFYHYAGNLPRVQQRFVLPPLLFKIAEWDELDLKHDWEVIQAKVKAGLAHELSEGDTILLGACRKGAGGERDLVSQPASAELAQSRAFSFKTSYLNRIIDKHQGLRDLEPPGAQLTFEERTLERFAPFLGASVEDICSEVAFFKSGPNHKAFLSDLSRRIIGTEKKSLPEFEDNAIEMKTVRLQVNGSPREHMSFPQFKFETIANQMWEDSELFEKVERKFLFVVFEMDNDGNLRLAKAFFWNMPYADRLEVRNVWERTKKIVKTSGTRFPKAGESDVAHVRPKADNKSDTNELPDGTNFPKQCFWLNREYIAQVIAGSER